MMDSYDLWTQATANLPWRVQHILYITLERVYNGEVTLAYNNGCHFDEYRQLSNAFDSINKRLEYQGINHNGIVSIEAAEIMLTFAAPKKPIPIGEQVNNALQGVAFELGIKSESTDADYTRKWLNALELIP